MSVEHLLSTVAKQPYLAVPKAEYPRERITRVTGGFAGETPDAWLVSCRHHLNPPATEEQIMRAESALGFGLISPLRNLLRQANGADLYIVTVTWMQPSFPAEERVRYHLLNTEEIVEINADCLQSFRTLASSDPKYENVSSLNYVAFCDAHDGNYLALLRNGSGSGRVFLLDKENVGYPYSESTSDLYLTVAISLEDWLALVMKSQGWRGFGEGRQPPI